MKVLFMGTPDFALSSLEEIYKIHDVVGIVTKEDKPNKRGGKIEFSPVKKFGIANNIDIYQPANVNSAEFIEKIKKINPDITVVAAYGKILSEDFINIPKFGTINIHSSLLPKYRGAAPINMAIINGEKESGISIMFVEKKLDSGDIIAQEKTDILEADDFLALHDRLKIIGSKLILKVLDDFEKNKINRVRQDENLVSFVKPFKKEDLKINWNNSSENICNFVRGLSPVPTGFTIFQNKILKIYKVIKYDKRYDNCKCGTIVEIIKKKGPVVKTEDGSVILLQVKPENKRIISGNDLVNCNFFKVGDRLEEIKIL